MKKLEKLLLIVSVAAIFTGVIIFTLTLANKKFDFTGFNNLSKETNTYQINEDFNSINIIDSETDINIELSSDGTNYLVSKEYKLIKHFVTVNNNTLEVKVNDDRKWYNKLFSFIDLEMTLFVTDKVYEKLSINSSTGDIKISNKASFINIDITASTADVECYADIVETLKIHVTTGDVEIGDVTSNNIDLKVTTGDVEAEKINCKNEFKIEVSTGDVELENITCNSLSSTGSTGSMQLDNVIVTETMEIKRSTGDVRFNKCDAKNITIETSTGDVRGSILTDKIFECETDTGKKQVPNSSGTGNCKITCDTGDIIIEIVK